MQTPHRVLVASEHRDRERRTAFRVWCFEVGAKLNQRVERTVVVAGSEESTDKSIRRRDHVVERALFLFVLRKTPREGISIAIDEATEQIDISERDSREHMMTCTTADQQIDDVSTRLRKYRSPPDHIDLVEAAEAIHVRPGIQQHAHRTEQATSRRKLERQRLIAILTYVRISAVLEQ